MRVTPTTISTFLALLLGSLLAYLYWPALTGTFVNYDDPLYLTDNPIISQGISWQTISWSFTSLSVGHWHPFTWLSHLAAVSLFGLKPLGHHLLNLLLHYANALLLAFALYRMTGALWRSWLVAVFFAIHPVNVESVAWIAERKGVLAAFFWLLALHSYLNYIAAPRWQRYLPLLLLFFCAIGSKAVAVTLPCVLLLLDIWPLKRYQPAAATKSWQQALDLFAEKIPLVALSALSGAGAIYTMVHGGGGNSFPFFLRLANVIKGYTGYVRELFIPLKLSVTYQFMINPSTGAMLTGLALLLIGSATVVYSRKRFPYLLSGWGWYLVTLAPVIGFLNLNLGQQTMPDRYAYLPLVGLLLMLVWGVGDLFDRLRTPRTIRACTALLVIALLTPLTRQQAGYWHDSKSLFTHEVALHPGSSLAHNNLGCALDAAEETNAALQEFETAIRLNAGNGDAWNNLGLIYGKTGQHGKALDAYRQALAIDPLFAPAHLNLGLAFVGLNDLPNARKEYRILLGLRPDYAAQLFRYLDLSREETPQ